MARPLKYDEPLHLVPARMPKSLADRVAHVARERGCSQADVIVAAIVAWLDRQPAMPPYSSANQS